MDLDPKLPVATLFRSIARRVDGLLLVALMGAFLTFAAVPSIPASLGLLRDVAAGVELRLAFLVMPFALIAEYLWFASSVGKRQHSLLLCAVLLATASIPFVNSLKGMFS
jgi:hypothetical protein